MKRDLNVMSAILSEKEKEVEREEQKALDAEGVAMAEHKRYTFDIIDTPVDPLR